MARVLIVDDSLMVRRLLAKTLTAAGHTIEGEAATGREALAAYEEARPDVVLLDLNMPSGDGFVALERIRENDPDSLVIVCSALARSRSTVVRALNAGAVDVLAKPFETQRLLDAIDAALEGREEGDR